MRTTSMPIDPGGRTRLAGTALRLILLVALAGCSGCSPPSLAGTNDVALEYVDDYPGPVATGRDERLLAAVKARLSAARLFADVAPVHAPLQEGGVRVVIDADSAGTADELLLWRGGLSVYRVDDAYPLPVTEAVGLGPAASGDPRDAGLAGPQAAVASFIRRVGLDTKHSVLAERLGPERWRTRVVVLPPIVGSAAGGTVIEAVAAVEHGRALAVGLTAPARIRLDAERRTDPQMRVALARGHTLVGTRSIDQALAIPAVVVPFGEDVTAYARVYRAERLLRSPVLPAMHRLSAERLPARWGLATACALLPFALSLAWLFFVRRFDRARPEPMWLVLSTFALGGLGVLPAALVESGLASISPWLDPSVVTLGGQLWALPLSLCVFALATGAVEEGCKWLAAWGLASRRREFDEPVDGIVYGCAAALGFAAMENVKYFALGRMSGAVIAMRAFVTIPAHMFFGALWGYAMGRRLVSRRTSVLRFFVAACVAHGAYDATLSTEGTQFVAPLLVGGLGVGFVAMLQRALRYGASPRGPGIEAADSALRDSPPLSTLQRAFFRVGSPIAFYASVTGMLACAFALTLLGSASEVFHLATAGPLVSTASALLALFGVAAYASSETIPLDVAVDAQGVTFAGSRSAWTQIEGVGVEGTRRRAFVRLSLTNDSVRLGPAPRVAAQRLCDAIAAGRRLPP